MNIAALMRALAIRDLGLTSKAIAMVVACRADRDTLGPVPLGVVAADLGRHPGHLERTIRAVDGRYLQVHKSVVYLGSAFDLRAPMRAPMRAPVRANRADDNSLRELDTKSPAAPPEPGAVGDKAAAAAALADSRDTLARAITARTSSRRRR